MKTLKMIVAMAAFCSGGSKRIIKVSKLIFEYLEIVGAHWYFPSKIIYMKYPMIVMFKRHGKLSWWKAMAVINNSASSLN